MSVLNVIDWILRILLNRKIQIELHLGIGFPHVEQNTGGVYGNLIKQIG